MATALLFPDFQIKPTFPRSINPSNSSRVSLVDVIDKKFWELAELKERERQLEDKLMQDYKIKIYAKLLVYSEV